MAPPRRGFSDSGQPLVQRVSSHEHQAFLIKRVISDPERGAFSAVAYLSEFTVLPEIFFSG